MRFGSLFTGIGGFDLGFEQAGHECAWQVEIDEACRRILHRRFVDRELREADRQQRPGRRTAEPTPAIHTDVAQVGAGNLTAVDLICGGFPCQDLSVAGRRAGLAGERSGLWFEFHRILAEIAPRWVLIENVPGLLSSNGGADMAVVLGGLEELGYGWAYRVLDAQYFGVAQRRRRVFIVGCFGDTAGAAQVLFESEGGVGDSAPRRETGTRPTNAVTGSTFGSGGADDNDAQRGVLVPVSTAEGTAEGFVPNLARTLSSGSHPNSNQPGRRNEDDVNLVTHAPLAHSIAVRGRDGGQEWELGEPEIGNALRVGGGGASWALTPQAAVRRLTPLECERLQGFPDEWTAGQADSTRYRQLGNAVCVPVARWIGERLARDRMWRKHGHA